MINAPLEIDFPEYYDMDQSEILDLIDVDVEAALEIGCATGLMLDALQKRGVKRIVGIEYVPTIADQAKRRCPTATVLCGDINMIADQDIGSEFDLIIASMVLEHLTNPWDILFRLKGLLRQDGQIIGTLPNIRHHSVTLPLLLQGKWEYQDQGILDRTHYRFFTKNAIISMLRDNGFADVRIEPMFGQLSSTVNRLTLGIFKNHLAYAYSFSGRARINV